MTTPTFALRSACFGILLVLVACTASAAEPEVNPENCKAANIQKMPKEKQKAFASKCFFDVRPTRSTPPRQW